MPKDEWGTKRMCPQCGSRFYDLRNDPMTCPVCEASFTVESLTANRSRTLVSDKAASSRASADQVIEDDDDLDAGDDSIDDDLLDDDDDDDVALDDIADVPTDEEEN